MTAVPTEDDTGFIRQVGALNPKRPDYAVKTTRGSQGRDAGGPTVGNRLART
jgi:hypothetical protein